MNALQWMQREAKKIRKARPRLSPQEVMKEAGRLYRKAKGAKSVSGKKVTRKKVGAKKVGAYKVIEKGEKRSTPARRVYRNVRAKSGEFKGTQKIGSLHSVMATGRKILLDQIGRLEGKYLMASTKTEKKRIRKMISEKSAQLRKLMV